MVGFKYVIYYLDVEFFGEDNFNYVVSDGVGIVIVIVKVKVGRWLNCVLRSYFFGIFWLSNIIFLYK